MIIYHNIQVKQDNPFKAAKNCNHFFLTSYISVWSNLGILGLPDWAMGAQSLPGFKIVGTLWVGLAG